MPLPFMSGGVGLVSLPDPISATWADIVGATDATNSDVAMNFAVGANRRVYASRTGTLGTLYYRINSGSWVSYLASGVAGAGALITLTPGQTLGWRATTAGGQLTNTVSVKDDARGDTIDTFIYLLTGGA